VDAHLRVEGESLVASPSGVPLDGDERILLERPVSGAEAWGWGGTLAEEAAAVGLKEAISEVMIGAGWQRCRDHLMRTCCRGSLRKHKPLCLHCTHPRHVTAILRGDDSPPSSPAPSRRSGTVPTIPWAALRVSQRLTSRLVRSCGTTDGYPFSDPARGSGVTPRPHAAARRKVSASTRDALTSRPARRLSYSS
jgi:hypothetical protein